MQGVRVSRHMPVTIGVILTNLDILINFGDIAEELKNKRTSDAYWLKEEEWLSKRIEENEKFNKSIAMSDETYKRRFTI